MRALLLDIDGVITNPKEKRITNETLLDDFIERLGRNEVVGLNTGRSLEWMTKEVLEPLERKIQEQGLSPELLRNVIAIGEKGGAWIIYSPDGTREEHIDPEIRIPEDLQQSIRALLRQGADSADFHQTMFDDMSKQTMVTIEMKNGLDHGPDSEFKKQQAQLKEKLQRILSQHPRGNENTVDATTIATDVENKKVGKGYGASKFLEIVRQRKISVGQFIAFGDSISDIEMAEELFRQGEKVTFVYLGEGNPWEGQQIPFPLDTTYAGQFDKGTTAFIGAHKQA